MCVGLGTTLSTVFKLMYVRTYVACISCVCVHIFIYTHTHTHNTHKIRHCLSDCPNFP